MIIFMIFLKTTEFPLHLSSFVILPIRVVIRNPFSFCRLRMMEIMKSFENPLIVLNVLRFQMQGAGEITWQPFRESC